MHSGRIGICAWQKNSFIDFPGTVSTVLFFEGCNLHCPWCHNPQIVRRQLSAVSLDEVADFLNNRKGLIDGVVLSGGEPTLHNSLSMLVDTFRKIGLKIKLDTNGLNPEILQEIQFDYIALDIKTSPSRYASLGCTFSDCEERLKRSIEIVRSSGKCGEIRIPCAPGFIDKKIALEIADLVSGVPKVFLQPLQYNTDFLDDAYKLNPALTQDELEEIQQIIGSQVDECKIRGK
jgi:pyruvate formate lyase activating enzyme